MAKKIAVILSGCGVYDGAEIHETVLTLLALHKAGAEVTCFAPDVDQMHVVDHQTGDATGEVRNVRTESARIARGPVEDLANYKADSFDALILPGGFGAAKNLSSFATKGAEMEVQEHVGGAIEATRAANKPIGAMCVAPTILAKILPGVSITLGAEGDAASAAVSMGASHTVTTHGEIVVDETMKVVTSPCYMLDANISQIEDGTSKLVQQVLSMVS